jgi:hypothetical protein
MDLWLPEDADKAFKLFRPPNESPELIREPRLDFSEADFIF